MAIKKVLVVDDSATERHILGELLTKEGFETIFAEDGEPHFRADTLPGAPESIVVDLRGMNRICKVNRRNRLALMPGLNGFQATRAITQDPATQHIPVIIVTTKGQETDKIWGVRQGAKDYVVKPVDGAELLGKIAALG